MLCSSYVAQVDGLGSRQLGNTPRRWSGDVGKLSGRGLGIDTELQDHGRISFVVAGGDMSEPGSAESFSLDLRGGWTRREHVHRAGRVTVGEGDSRYEGLKL